MIVVMLNKQIMVNRMSNVGLERLMRMHGNGVATCSPTPTPLKGLLVYCTGMMVYMLYDRLGVSI